MCAGWDARRPRQARRPRRLASSRSKLENPLDQLHSYRPPIWRLAGPLVRFTRMILAYILGSATVGLDNGDVLSGDRFLIRESTDAATRAVRDRARAARGGVLSVSPFREA